MPVEDALGTAWHDRIIRETMIETKTLITRSRQRDTPTLSAETVFSCKKNCCHFKDKKMAAAAAPAAVEKGATKLGNTGWSEITAAAVAVPLLSYFFAAKSP